jgi:hypothetical protein
MTYDFCTFFDHRYLAKGLALYHSLRQHCPQFQLWILCFDQPCYEVLSQIALPEVRLIRQEEFERSDTDLLKAKTSRTLAEYYFTCKPSLPWFVFNHHPEVDLITYLDADLFFFASPASIYQDMANSSIAVVGHCFSPELLSMQVYGRYNAGWVAFRRDAEGLAGLRWWRERCLEWCYDRIELGRFADQKYLDLLPILFQKAIVISQKGVNLARWNLRNYTLREVENQFWVDEQPLIFYHFHGVAEVEAGIYAPNLENELFTGAVYALFVQYFQVLNSLKQQLAPWFPQVSIGQTVRGQAIPAQSHQDAKPTVYQPAPTTLIIPTVPAVEGSLLNQPVSLQDLMGPPQERLSGAELFIQSLEGTAQPFMVSMTSQNIQELLTIEQTIAGSSLWSSEGREKLFQYYNSYPNDGYLNLWTGLVRQQHEQHTEAVSNFINAINLGCNHWRVAWYLAQSAEKINDLATTENALRAILQVEPNFEPAQKLWRRLTG